MVALRAGFGGAGGADLKDFGEKGGVCFGGIAEPGPIRAASALDDVVNRGEGEAWGLDVAVEHCGEVKRLGCENKSGGARGAAGEC